MFLCLVTLQFKLTGLDVRELENVLKLFLKDCRKVC